MGMDARYRDVMERYQRMDPEHFNDVLDGIADALAMTDAEISEASGISRQTINGMRGGRARIKPDKLWPLASALGADVEVFFLPDVASDDDAGCFGEGGQPPATSSPWRAPAWPRRRGEERLYNLGLGVCRNLDGGNTIDTELAGLVDDARLSPGDAGALVGAAVTDMCPQHGPAVEEYLATH